MANFDLSNLALQSVCPGNKMIYDDKEMPSVMVFVPKFKLSDVLATADNSTHPAFIRNGVEIPGFWFGKYQTHFYNGRAYSLPCEDPSASATLDTFVSNTRAKGDGWHEATSAEWAAIALWCKKNGTMPYGNNNYGKDTRESLRSAIPTYIDGANSTGRVATGTGPVTWSHDKTLSGIWDMNGNVWEWVTGLRLVYGEVQIIPNNDASDPSCDLSANSGAWKAIKASDGTLVTPDGNGTTAGTVKMDWLNNKCTYSTTITVKADAVRGCPFKDVTFDASIGAAAKLLLQALAMAPEANDTGYDDDYFYFNNGCSERCQRRGGGWRGGVYAGLFNSYLIDPRSGSSVDIGGRSAFVE